MTRRGISTLALVLPPFRRSEDVIVLSEAETDESVRPDLRDLAATKAAQHKHGE